MGGLCIDLVDPGARPVAQRLLHQLAHAVVGLQLRAETEGIGQVRAGAEALRQAQAAAERLQLVLSGPGGGRVANADRLAAPKSPHRIGHDPVGRPVAATDHVSGAGNAKVGGLVRLAAAKAGAPASDRQFRRRLAAAVGVMAAEGIVFAVAVEPLFVALHILGGDQHRRAGRLQAAQGFQQVDCAHHMGGPGGGGLGITAAHQGLGSQVQHQLRGVSATSS